MSAYAALVLNNVCRSNHHRLAIMALDHLKAHENERWRDLFLKYHPTYIKGSKAPDEEFKDFKRWFEELGARPAVQKGMAVGSDLSTDVTKLPPEEQARIRKMMYNQRARPVPA